MNVAIKLALAAAVALPAAPVLAQATSAMDYVKQAGASDLYERDSSRLVLTTTHNPKVRQFAQHMIKDHTKSTAEVKAAAMKAHMHPMPPRLNAMQASNMAKLRAAHGAMRDQMYLQQQGPAHEMALQLHQSYAANGDSAPLKMAANKIVPVIQEHINDLHGITSSGM